MSNGQRDTFTSGDEISVSRSCIAVAQSAPYFITYTDRETDILSDPLIRVCADLCLLIRAPH